MVHLRTISLAILLSFPLLAQEKTKIVFSGSIQSGFASTFQLTLGGTFGAGPAFQNKLNLSLNNVFAKNDAWTAFGWDTLDTPTCATNFQYGVWYKFKPFKTKKQRLVVSAGVQRWQLNTVGPGTRDWLSATNWNWQGHYKLNFWSTTDTWTLLHSNMPMGSLLYTQGGLQHTLLKRDNWTLTLKHGPAYTYSWGFYGKEGSRVLRYGGALAANFRQSSLEVYFRQQDGLQPGIPNNQFWSVLYTQNFGR
jgi:hypothetical protein